MSSREEREEITSGGEAGVVAGGEGAAGETTAAMGDAGGSTGETRGEVSRSGNTPPTPMVEELLKAAEDGAGGSGEATTESGAAVVGRFTATPALRTATVEPQGGDSGIGASEPVPFAEGDFLETADPRDILDALGVDPQVADVLWEVESPDVRVAATLLGVILSQGGGEGGRLPEEMRMHGEESEPEEMLEVRVTAVDQAKAFTKDPRPNCSHTTYAPRSHCFKPAGITGYVPASADYLGDLLLRDRDRHISSSWTTVMPFNRYSCLLLKRIIL